MTTIESRTLPPPVLPPAIARPAATGIDPRGPQFNAGVTAVILAAALVTPLPVAVTLTFVQAGLFAIGAFRGVQRTPQAWVFRRFVQPRLAPPVEREDPRPPRFAQAVGLVFLTVAFVAYALQAPVVALVATGFALVAALLNAIFRFCLGCELYLVIQRSTALFHPDRAAGANER